MSVISDFLSGSRLGDGFGFEQWDINPHLRQAYHKAD
jgi:hypothetical protein